MNPLLLFIPTVFLCMGLGHESPQNHTDEVTTRKKIDTKHQMAHRNWVFVASTSYDGSKRAHAALKKVGIAAEEAGSRSIGIKVQRKDFTHAKRVLAADAKLHHYTITIYSKITQ